MAAAALVLYVLFLLLVGGVGAWLHYRRTGDHGMSLRAANALTRLVGLLLLAGIIFGGMAPAAELLGIARSFQRLDVTWSRATGLALAVAGMTMVMVSQYQMGNSWRVGVDPLETTELIRQGLFGVVRNPIFTGVIIAAAGLLMAVPNVLSAVAVLSVVVGLELQVRAVEEPYLTSVHGDRYVSYARAVGRFVPGVGRFAR
jgi:protein-S-isoprenylcysteine O-methyltransferase Ste14